MLITEVKVDPRVKRTRQLLQDALDDLLSEKSFNQITVQDITERAGLNRATFYAHFEDKYALLNHSVREGFQAILDKNLPESPTFTPENLRRLILSVCEYLGGFAGSLCAGIRSEYRTTDDGATGTGVSGRGAAAMAQSSCQEYEKNRQSAQCGRADD